MAGEFDEKIKNEWKIEADHRGNQASTYFARFIEFGAKI